MRKIKKNVYTRICKRCEEQFKTKSKCGKICENCNLQSGKKTRIWRNRNWDRERLREINIKIQLLNKERDLIMKHLKK